MDPTKDRTTRKQENRGSRRGGARNVWAWAGRITTGTQRASLRLLLGSSFLSNDLQAKAVPP